MGGLFAPAYIHGNPEAEAAVQKWQAENFALTPADDRGDPGAEHRRLQTQPWAAWVRQYAASDRRRPSPARSIPWRCKIYAQGGKYKGAIPLRSRRRLPPLRPVYPRPDRRHACRARGEVASLSTVPIMRQPTGAGTARYAAWLLAAPVPDGRG